MRRRDLFAGVATLPVAASAHRYGVTARTLSEPALPLIAVHDNESGLEASLCPSQDGELSLRLHHKGKWTELLYRAADYRPAAGWRGKALLLWPATGRSFDALPHGGPWFYLRPAVESGSAGKGCFGSDPVYFAAASAWFRILR